MSIFWPEYLHVDLMYIVMYRIYQKTAIIIKSIIVFGIIMQKLDDAVTVPSINFIFLCGYK